MACMSCSKGFLYFLNGIFMLMGFIFIGLGVYMYVDPSLSLLNQFPKLPFSTMWPPVLFGSGLVVLSTLGCCGAASVSDNKDKGCKIGIVVYFVLCFVLLVAQIGVFVWILTQMGVIDASKAGISQDKQDDFAKQVQQAITDFLESDPDNIKTWYMVEEKLTCCGYTSTDETKDTLAKECPVETTATTPTCETALFAVLQKMGMYGMIGTGVIMGIQILAITCACCLMCHKPTNDQKKEAQKLDDNLNPYYG